MELSLSMNYVRQGRPGIDQKISDDKTIILDGEEILFLLPKRCLLSILALLLLLTLFFTVREPNVYKPHGFFLGFLATFLCFCVTVLFYRLFVFCGKKKHTEVRIVNLKFLPLLWQKK